ncbi:hypothetical protein KY285_026146 [Solanum tuberosum]|nr:hypothetical protein KY285_026146 [Solanum tuberosum]
MEPFEHPTELEEFGRKLGMKYAVANANNKIWAFIEEDMEYSIVRDEDQMLTLKLQNQGLRIEVLGERLDLWASLDDLSRSVRLPWLVGCDFNVICNEEEKLGGRPVSEGETRDFNHCINVCNLEDQGFKGSKYTWWNGRTDGECIFKRLDRVLCNDGLQTIFPFLEVEHLVRSGSAHIPLLITSKTTTENVVRPFKFMNFWLKEESFMEEFKKHWQDDFEGDPFILFHHKLKKVKKALTHWSKAKFGNIFQDIITLEEIIKVHEVQFEIEPSGDNREKLHKAQAKWKKQLQREEEFWKQKAGMEWFREGEEY